MSSAELRKIYETVETVGGRYPYINHQLKLVVNETEKLSITVLTVYNYYKTVYRIGLLHKKTYLNLHPECIQFIL